MRRLCAMWFGAYTAMACWSSISAGAAAAELPPDRVLVMYFHRTECCSKGRMLESLIKEAVARDFANEAKAGKVEFRSIDFEKDERIAEAYKISQPALVVAEVRGGQVGRYTNFDSFWAKYQDRAFTRDKKVSKEIQQAFATRFREVVLAYLK